MMQSLGILSAILLIIGQFLLGLVAHWRLSRLKHRFNYKLTSEATTLDLLEGYINIYESINVKVNADIKLPAIHKGDLLWLNRDFVNRSNLFNTTATILQIVIGREENRYMRSFGRWQVLLWLLEVVSFYLALSVDMNWLVVSLILGVFLVIYTLCMYVLYGEVVIEALDNLFVILDLSAEERQASIKLGKRFNEDVFKYGFTPIKWVYEFFKIPGLNRR